MSLYINRGNEGFAGARRSCYVDKSGLITVINATLDTECRFSCVTRSRRFGKTMAAEMLCAYYDESCDSHQLFDDLKIAENASYRQHLNRYPVIFIDITDFTTRYRNSPDIIPFIQSEVKRDILAENPGVIAEQNGDLMAVLTKVCTRTGKKFILIMDEWDAVLREYEGNDTMMNSYVDFLRRLFKGSASKSVFAGVYMTGILPIKKYKTESALNNFVEYSVVNPGRLSKYFGFTGKEVVKLCEEHQMNVSEMEEWYDGYRIGDENSIFNPYSVMTALRSGVCSSYWATTGAYDSVKTYIQMNFDGLKDDIIRMLSGGRCRVNTTKFQNDMYIINTKDDVFTVLIHLGYLSYDRDRRECWIPNKEVRGEFTNAVEDTSWKRLSDALKASQDLLEATLRGDEAAVAEGVNQVHDANTSILSYNDENSLACVLSIAWYYAQNDYVIHREYATGKGFADLVMIPRRNVDSPAVVVELKLDRSADTAIDRIKGRNYPAKLAEYTGDILLVGISYDRESKEHKCRIEKWTNTGL